MGNTSSVMEGSEEGAESGSFISKRLSHGCSLFIQDEKARGAFVKFLQDGDWIQKYVQDSNNTKIPNQEVEDVGSAEAEEKKVEEAAPETYNDYQLPGGTTLETIQTILGDPNAEIDGGELGNIIDSCFSQGQLRAVLLASVFPLFLESKEYQVWVEKQTNANVDADATAEAVETVELSDSAKEKAEAAKEDRLDELFVPSERRMKDIVNQAIASADAEELDTMLLGGDWLKSLMVAVEDLPLCVSLATARPERQGFPLVYVNKAFENATGYNR
jgi:hypothetical protein